MDAQTQHRGIGGRKRCVQRPTAGGRFRMWSVECGVWCSVEYLAESLVSGGWMGYWVIGAERDPLLSSPLRLHAPCFWPPLH